MALQTASPLIAAEEFVSLHTDASNLVVLDLEGDPSRAIDGAIPVTIEKHFAGEGGGTKGARPLPGIGVLQAHVREWGINPDTNVVVCDDSSGLKAARAWWVLRWAGLRKVRLLDGGARLAFAAGVRRGRFAPPPGGGTAMLSAGHLPVIDADKAAGLAGAGILLDARSASAFAGDPGNGQGGHIPGARHAPASANLSDTGRFLDVEVLRARYEALGVDRSLPIGVSCGSGVSATHDILALDMIGVQAALFPGSWSAWSADRNRPVAYGI